MKTYLFDFDGTLVDSMPTWSGVMKRILDEGNVPYGSDLIKIITPLGALGTARYFISLGLKLTEEEILEKMNRNIKEVRYLKENRHIINVQRLIQQKKLGIDMKLLLMEIQEHGALVKI